MTDVPLSEAQAWLREQAARHGAKCPCCGQFAKVYKRPLNSGMARSLIAMYRAAGTEWQHIPTTLSARSREEGKLRYWGLVEESTQPRDDGGRAGWWRVTDDGAAFVRRVIRVPKYVLLYDAHFLGYEGPEVGIIECLGKRFNWYELMGDSPDVSPFD